MKKAVVMQEFNFFGKNEKSEKKCELCQEIEKVSGGKDIICDFIDKVNLFAAAHPFISVDNEPYMFCRSGAYTVINTTIYVPTMDDNVTVPCSKHIVISTIMVYTKKAAYNSKNAQFAEKTLEKILKKKYEGIE